MKILFKTITATEDIIWIYENFIRDNDSCSVFIPINFFAVK